jgi:nuclear pore complex protein Nup98-Nup96
MSLFGKFFEASLELMGLTSTGFGATTTNATGFGSTATANPFSGGASGFGQNTGGTWNTENVCLLVIIKTCTRSTRHHLIRSSSTKMPGSNSFEASSFVGVDRTIATARTRIPLPRALPLLISSPTLSSIPENDPQLTITSTGFGSNNTASATSLFGPKPNPFATSTSAANTGGSLFGNTGTANTAFGNTNAGFGASNTANTGFGANNNTGSGFSFGQNKTSAFGSGATGGLFGQSGQGTTGGFGAASSSPFGGSGSGTALSNQPVPPSEGTASTPFAPTVEKDTPTSTQSNAYQSISFMPPYQKYSFEELRLADYNSGRRFGNGTGQAGAFGSSTFGGGFGNTNTGGFGSNTSTTGGLFGGGQQSSSSGFGSNTSTTGFGGGGLFGNNSAAKPGGLFGQQSSSNTSGGLFGTSNNTTGGFGSNNATGGFGTANNNTGGLFGNNNSQAKPGGLFGSNNTATTNTGFSFGSNNTTTSASTGGGLFGNNNQQQTSTGFGGGFGANNQTQAKPSLFGNTPGGFGATSTQGQSTSLFGTSNNNPGGGGLFGQTNNTNQPSGGLFGNAGTTGGGLFGQNNTNNDVSKPAGGGLFGSSFGNTNTNSGGGLFGNNNNQQQQQTQGGGGLFGSNNATAGGFSFGNTNNQQQKPSLFGNTSINQTGGGLFAQTNNNNNAGSMFGTSMNNSQQQAQQNTPRTASALDQSAYSQQSIWTGLPTVSTQNSTPLVTPLRAAQKLKDSKARPQPSTLKLTQSRYMTPPQKRPGFGFSYSTYGTPNSAASTPGTGGIYRNGFAGSLGRSSLGKSFSASNLRQHYANDGDSVMSPGAMTPKIANFSTGSMRRLKIDHTLRQDLFSPRLPALPPANGVNSSANPSSQIDDTPAPIEAAGKPTANDQPRQQPKKRVSFDRETTGGGLNGESGTLVRTEENDETSSEEPQPRATRGRPIAKPTNGEMEQVRGNELAVVPEDRVSDNETSMRLPSDVNPQPDPEPGNYWMKPTRSELQKMPRDKLKAFTGLQVGRRGCGYVTFKGPVDLTTINMDDIFDKIVEIRVRSITVYPESSSKPPVGKGLNVPSTLYIENSWPRARNKPSAATSGPVFDKHINRLRRMAGTEFLNYDVQSGVWTFKVPHYTRYGLDYDEDDELGDSVVGLPSREDSPEVQTPDNMDVETSGDSDPEDTFVGKQKTVPGGFGRSSLIPYDDEDQGSENSVLPSDAEDSDNDVDMVGSFPVPAKEATPETATPRPTLKASMRPWGTPGRPLLDLDGDWAEQLQRTISPRKQNRETLRNLQSKVLLDRAYEPIQPQRAANEKEFRTSIDVMNSLFGQHQQRVKEANSVRKPKQGQEADFEV